MLRTGNYLYLISFLCLLLFAGCQKADIPELETSILFSVDFDENKFALDYRKAYLAAYTSDGKLINYGNLSDSVKWELKSQSSENKIDILYFEVTSNGYLNVEHIKDVPIGQKFVDSNKFVTPDWDYFGLTLKVEDFGNRRDNNTSLTFFECIAHDFIRGSSYSGNLIGIRQKTGIPIKLHILSQIRDIRAMNCSFSKEARMNPTYIPWIFPQRILLREIRS